MIKEMGSLARALVLGLFGALLLVQPSRAEPVTIRYALSPAAEEQLWLLLAKPDLGANYGRSYTIETARFPSADKAAQAFDAGAIDLGSTSASGLLIAAAAGVPVKFIASIAKESLHGDFSTSFMALADSPINAVKDLKGKSIGINGFGTAGELWAKAALGRSGLKADDVTFVPVSFPAMVESVHAGKVDVGEFPQPFAAIAQSQFKLKTVFTAKTGAPFDEELVVMAGRIDFLKSNGPAVRAFLSDLREATKYYLEHTKEARLILIEKKFARVDPAVYLDMKDYLRDPTLRINIDQLKQQQDLQMSTGLQSKKADIDALVDMSFLPK